MYWLALYGRRKGDTELPFFMKRNFSLCLTEVFLRNDSCPSAVLFPNVAYIKLLSLPFLYYLGLKFTKKNISSATFFLVFIVSIDSLTQFIICDFLEISLQWVDVFHQTTQFYIVLKVNMKLWKFMYIFIHYLTRASSALFLNFSLKRILQLWRRNSSLQYFADHSLYLSQSFGLVHSLRFKIISTSTV